MRTMVTRGLLAAAVASAAGFGLAGGATAGRDDRFTLRLVEIEGPGEYLDLGAPGESRGDILLFNNQLLERNGDPAGRARGVCTKATDARFHCVGSLRLDGGTLQLANTIRFTEDQPTRFAITGGTGAYRDAFGQAVATPTTPGRFRLVITGGHAR